MAKKNSVTLFAILLATASLLVVTGCQSTGTPVPSTSTATAASLTPEEKAADQDLKSRLDSIIDRRLDKSASLKALASFRIGGYDIQDPETFWGHRAIGGGGSPWSEYYLTYRNHYLIMLLKDDGKRDTCVDLRIMDRTSRDYELTTGRVEVNGVIDEEVIVLFNRNWQGDSTTDVRAAFKPDITTGKILDIAPGSIRVYREE